MECLTVRGPFDSLIVYYDLTSNPEDFFYGGSGRVDVGVQPFWSIFLFIVIWSRIKGYMYIFMDI